MADESADRLLWRPEVQGADAASVLDGLGDEWARAFDGSVPFFGELYAQSGLGPGSVPALDEIPVTTKAMLRTEEESHPRFGRHRSVGPERAARVSASTGTTGQPWLIFYSSRDLDTMVELQYQHTWRVGMRRGDHFAHSWPGGMYPTAVLGGRHFLDLGILEIPVGPPFTPEQAVSHVALWRDLGVDALMCTGSQLITYDEAAEQIGIDLGELLEGARLIIVEASCQFEAPRRRIESTYGVKVHNISGAAEVLGLVTSDCDFHTGLHIPSGHHLVQVCDPETGREVPDGQRGTLVASVFGLDSFCLRYDLEDIVVGRTDPCPCGQTGRRYDLLGRAADQALIGSASVLPLDVQLALEDLGAPEFVLQAGRHDTLTVKVESPDASELSAHLQKALDVPVTVESVPEGTLPRAAFKPRRIAN